MYSFVVPEPFSLPETIKRLMDWQRTGRHPEVLRETASLLERTPENCDLLTLAAVSLRHQGRFDEALRLHDRLAAVRPRFSLMYQERALCHVQRRALPDAIEALQRAVEINPAMPACWQMLEDLYRQTGNPAKAAAARSQIAALTAMPGPVIVATGLFSDGLLIPAEQMIRSFLNQQGEHPEGLRLLAKIAVARNAMEDAERYFAGALRLAPHHQAARRDYAEMLIQNYKFGEAREQADRLLALDPYNPDFVSLAAAASMGVGEEHRALALYRALIVDKPETPEVHLWSGHGLMMISQTDAAISAYRRAALLRPDYGDAYWSLANLKRYRFTDEELARMRVWGAAPATASADRYHLCFALGKGLEDRREYAESWRYYQWGNALVRAKLRYRPDQIESSNRKQIELCTPAFFEQRKGWGDHARDPIFILGLPRSGSTLVEQILASHSQVEGTQELTTIDHIAFDLQGRRDPLDDARYPAQLGEMKAEQFRALGQAFLRETKVHRARGKPFFIDKMPNNFRHIGLIHLMLPNAKIIDVRREPLSCCFSNYKQLFAQGQEFSYGLEDIARYYRSYLDLMRHWDEVLPGRVLRVQYEDVVEDLEGSVARILDHCGLPYEEACIEYHKTERSIRTPSSEQVRQPIFRDGLDQWRNFEPWLEPLKRALGDALLRYRL
jgi:tetratricopeptide (TPR) repeat protein